MPAALYALLIALPVSLLLHFFLPHAALWIFLTACLAIVPLAGIMGTATEDLSKHLGPQKGGLLNATFGNATEIIIGLFALHAGLLELVRASIVGSIIGNVLLVMGASILAGGLRYKIQRFNQDLAQTHAINLFLASMSLAVPAIFAKSFGHTQPTVDPAVQTLSYWMAGLLLLLYAASLVFSLRTHESLFRGGEEYCQEPPCWSKTRGLATLLAATVLISVMSEILVQSVEGAARALHVNDIFIGIIIVAIIGNAAEHSTAVWMAMKNKMDISLNIAIGSSVQIAMFVAPLLVFASAFLGHKMTYIFTVPELTSIGFSVVIAAFIAGDGKSHWMEGAQLLAAYLLLALAFFFLPP